MSLQPVLKYLTKRATRIEVGEHLVIREWRIEYLPPTGPPVDETLAEKVEVEVKKET